MKGMVKCKHDAGWCAEKMTHIFIHPDGNATMEWQGKNRLAFKIRMRCNYPDCKAKRNAYFYLNVSCLGKIRMEKGDKE